MRATKNQFRRQKSSINSDSIPFGLDEIAAIRGLRGVAASHTVTTIEEDANKRHILPVVSTETPTVHEFSLYDVTTADVNFEFTTDDRTVLVPLHKCLLANQSDVFKKMFFSEMREEVSVITQVKIVDAEPEEFIEFTKCFYLEPTVITAINVTALTYLTHKYNVEYFENKCKAFLTEMVKTNIVSIFWVLPMATLFNYDDLWQTCDDLIHLNGRILMECLEYENCSLETLTSVLNIHFIGRDEAIVFEKCISWAKESCKQKEIEPTSRENVRNQLGDCLDLIRFEKMSPSQFVQCLSKHSFMFHPDEIVNIEQIAKGQEQEFDTVVVPPVIKVRCTNNKFKRFLLEKNEDIADIFFKFRNATSSEGKYIAAHKCILSAYSPIFKSELIALTESNTIHVTDASLKEYTALIRILYGRFNLRRYHSHLSNENIDKVLMLVKKYNVRCGYALDYIENELMLIQDHENLFWLFELSRIHSLQFLYCLCIDRIESGQGIFSSESFLNLCQESFKNVFSIVVNNCDASTVCMAGMKWAEEFCARNHLTNSGENIRMVLGDFWSMMPFADLEPVEFIRYRHDLGDIFSSEEIKMIIDKMANEYETESDTNRDEWDASESDEENGYSLSDSSVSNMESESDDNSSLENDALSDNELLELLMDQKREIKI